LGIPKCFAPPYGCRPEKCAKNLGERAIFNILGLGAAKWIKIRVTVCHYPPGTSKYDPIEHRLFSEISKNWAGKPLRSYEMASKYIRSTRIATGLEVKAWIDKKQYEKGIKIIEDEMKAINIIRHPVLPEWN
jgi:hypothetical protein